jgi:hypothetical protein
VSKFGRVVKIVVGDRALSSVAPGGGPGLHLAFSVTRSVDRSQDQLTATAWGVHQSTLSLLQADRTACSIAAGYGTPTLLGVGRVVPGTLRVDYEGRQPRATWQISDGGIALRAIDVSRAWSTVRASEALDYVLALSGLARGAIDLGADVTYSRGLVLCDSAEGAIQQIAADTRSAYAVQSGVLHMWPRDGARQRLRVVVSTATGLVGDPEPADKGRWRVVVSLEPTVRPGDEVRVDSTALRGILRVVDVEHAGDSGYELPFYSSITGVPV